MSRWSASSQPEEKPPVGGVDPAERARPPSPVDPALELTDPTPDIHQLFAEYNERFFKGRLGAVEVKWSSKMTSTIGYCCYEGENGLCSIKLSEPLLKLLPRKELVETLLHEMIHAYLFVHKRDYQYTDRGHGPSFLKHMRRINESAGTAIEVYHRFYEEMAACRQHWYRCDGPCGQRRPCFAAKRHRRCPPWPRDAYWLHHKAACGGSFRKERAAGAGAIDTAAGKQIVSNSEHVIY